MKIENNTDFIVESMPVTGPGNKPFQAVIVKGTFDFSDGWAQVAPSQVPFFYSDVLFDDEDSQTIKFESDIIPFKPATDIVVTGHAYSPDDEEITSFEAGVQVGDVGKKIRVFGDRVWEQEEQFQRVYRISKPEPVEKVELRYEKAFGGSSPDNSRYVSENVVGTGYLPEDVKEGIDKTALPNIESPEALIRKWHDAPKPAGLGFYPRNSEPRLSCMGTYDENWRENVSPGLPEDFDYAFFNGAHPDLQTKDYLHGDESVDLLNLTPQGDLSFKLPGVRPECHVKYRYQEDEKPLSLVLDTLCLMTDENTFYMIWRGLSPIKTMASMEIEQIRIS